MWQLLPEVQVPLCAWGSPCPTSPQEGPHVLALCLVHLYLGLAMYTASELQRVMGYTRRQFRLRLDALAAADSLLEGQVRKGSRNALEYTPAVADMLRDLDVLAQRPGVTLAQAAGQLVQRIRGNGHQDAPEQGPGTEGHCVQVEGQVVVELRAQVAQLKGQVADLKAERDAWRGLALGLQGRVLPAPRRSLWRWLRRV